MKIRHAILISTTAGLLAIAAANPLMAKPWGEGRAVGNDTCMQQGMRAQGGGPALMRLDNMTETQRQQIQELIRANRDSAQPQREEMRELRRQISQAESSHEREALASQLAEHFRQQVLSRSELHAQIRAVLTDEQRMQWDQQRQQGQERMERRAKRS